MLSEDPTIPLDHHIWLLEDPTSPPEGPIRLSEDPTIPLDHPIWLLEDPTSSPDRDVI